MTSTAHSAAAGVELDDIQGLVRYGFKHLTRACFMLLRVRNREAARAWLATVPVASAAPHKPVLDTVVQIGLTAPGLQALGVPDDIVHGFSAEFIDGLGSDPSRARRLGDIGPSAPEQWQWGGPHQVPHVLVLLYATPERLDALIGSVGAQVAAGFDLLHSLATGDLDGNEPFGFVDGIAQPRLDWERNRAVEDADRIEYTNLSCLGEFLLGYPNEYGRYTDRPTLPTLRDPAGLLMRAEDDPGKVDLGRNGSYLVLRQLRQDVSGFWRFLDRQAGGDPKLRQGIAEAMVGRRMSGAPLMDRAPAPIAGVGPDAQDLSLNGFTYAADAAGTRCPLGAHIRRSNPRNADLPPGATGIVGRLIRMLGFDQAALRQDLVASTRFHRLLRRGRKYGASLSPAQVVAGDAPSPDTGLYFICLGANIARQFEFVQGAWVMGHKFNGLENEGDPLLGNRAARGSDAKADGFSMPQASGPDRCIAGLPQFVTVVGGAYFFLPGIRALRYLATARS